MSLFTMICLPVNNSTYALFVIWHQRSLLILLWGACNHHRLGIQFQENDTKLEVARVNSQCLNSILVLKEIDYLIVQYTSEQIESMNFTHRTEWMNLPRIFQILVLSVTVNHEIIHTLSYIYIWTCSKGSFVFASQSL